MGARGRIYAFTESSAYGRGMSVVITASLVPLCFWESFPLLDALEYACTAVFLADYAMRWATADMRLHRGAASFALYPLTPMAVIDMLTILPSFLAVNEAWRALRVLRLLRALRAFRMVRYSRNITALLAAFERKRGQLYVVAAFAAGYVLVCAMVMFNVEHETFPDYFDALYWSVVSLTTVGYGDLYPATDAGRVVAIISALMGVAVVAMPAGIITAGLLEELEEGEKDGREEEGHTGAVVQLEARAGNHAGEAQGVKRRGYPAHQAGQAAEGGQVARD